MPQITKQYKFCAAHKYWNDKWDEDQNKKIFDKDVKVHGHNYDLFVTVNGPVNDDSGFIINLKELNNIVNEKVISVLDHSMIQDHPWFKNKQPSTENLVIFIWSEIENEIDTPARLHRIRLRETGTIFTEYFGE